MSVGIIIPTGGNQYSDQLTIKNKESVMSMMHVSGSKAQQLTIGEIGRTMRARSLSK